MHLALPLIAGAAVTTIALYALWCLWALRRGLWLMGGKVAYLGAGTFISGAGRFRMWDSVTCLFWLTRTGILITQGPRTAKLRFEDVAETAPAPWEGLWERSRVLRLTTRDAEGSLHEAFFFVWAPGDMADRMTDARLRYLRGIGAFGAGT
jgi:hypothetical protein